MVSIAKHLREVPEESANLVLKRSEVSDALYNAIDALKKREIEVAGQVEAERNGDSSKAYPNESARAAEIQRRLAADTVYQVVNKEIDSTRKELKGLDARMESVTRRHESDICMASMVASLLKVGTIEDADEVLAAYGGIAKESAVAGNTPDAAPPSEPAVTQPAASEAQEQAAEQKKESGKEEEGGLEAGTFEVIEARPTKKEGTYRAYCVSRDNGEKVAIYAKNGQGITLAGSVGKSVDVKYNRVDKGLFAVSVSVVG